MAPTERPAKFDGPALVYRHTDGREETTIDTTAVTDDRQRAVCRALLNHALTLLDDAEADGKKNPVGF